jgi:beta-aspartyl-peptidase (threonine type)
VAFSGDGENIARVLLAARVMQALEAGVDPRRAVQASLDKLARVGGEAGGVAIDRQGRIGFAHNSSHFAVAWVTEGMNVPSVYLRQDDESE